MGIFEGILLVSDFDGTFTGLDGKIPERNIEAVKYFIAEGGFFTISTGRTKRGFHNFNKDYINAPVILGNGAMAYDYNKNSIVFTNGITDVNLPQLKLISENSTEKGMEFYSENGEVFVYKGKKENYDHFRSLQIDDFTEINNLELINFPLVKVMIITVGNSMAFQQFLSDIDMNEMKYIPTEGSFVEVLSLSAGKGRALYQLADFLGTPHSKVFCAGDGSNDADMLSAAAYSFCPKGSSRLASESADFIVCSSGEGAIADAIEIIKERFT